MLKADIKHYFDTVSHNILLNIIKKKINDRKIIWLIRQILQNHHTKQGIGMSLGNLTSQFFADVYLNELDYFIKQQLKVKYYIRYVDDFIILECNTSRLLDYRTKINEFLRTLKLKLHPDKSKIITLHKGINLLGFRVFYYHKLLKKSNIRKMKRKLLRFKEMFDNHNLEYDKIYFSL